MISLIVEVFIKAFLLVMLVYIVARDEADYDFRKVTMVTGGIVLGCVIIEGLLTPHIGLLVLLPMAALVVFMVMQFCWVRFWRSLLIAIPFLILNTMISTATYTFNLKAQEAMSRGMRGPVTDEDMREAFKFYNQSVADGKLPDPFQKKKEIKIPETTEQILMKLFSSFFSSNFSFHKMPVKALSGLKTTTTKPESPGLPMKSAPHAMAADKPSAANEGIPADLVDWQEAENKITISGTLIGRDGARIAIVNDQIVHEGEHIQVIHKKMIYRWKACAIGERSVSWERVEALKK